MDTRRAACILLLWLFTVASLGQRASIHADESPLRYDWQVGQVFAYRAKIVVDLPDKVETYQGTIQYTVKSVEQDHRAVTYQGGLPQSTKPKSTGRPGLPPRFGPGFRPPIPPLSPFSRSNFRGSEQTTSEITLSARGAVTHMKGDSHLPYLLGNVSLLPFEPLPEAAQQQWQVTSGASITEKDERQNMRPWMGPFDPFGRGVREEAVQAATESTSYQITDAQGPLVTVAKTYELKSPSPKDGEPSFVLAGAGTWQFHRKLSVSESLNMELKLVIDRGNQQVTVPITVEYRRLTDEELAEAQAAREAQLAERRRRTEELAAEQADKKRLAELPLTDEEKTAAMDALSGENIAALKQTLEDLAKKELQQPDPEIAQAIERLLNHVERQVREAAHAALLRWSLEYRPRGELDRQYKGPGSVPSTARVVAADTPLFVGQIVQLRDRNRWVPADILDLQSDGQIKVHPRGWNTTAWDKTVTRDLIQLAPEHLFQPHQAPDESGESGLRIWTDVTGTHKIEAAYLGVADGAVQLKRKDGREIRVPLEQMSQEDQHYVQQQQQSAERPPNPFD
jgi:hypothetical protein